jgi:sigma-B regulation protein RsbU (phosphoserine phosphatase)
MRFSFKRTDGPDADHASSAEFPNLAGATIAGLVYGKRVGGDFYQGFRASEQRVVFGLLDVAGNAEENRGIVEAARAAFRTKGPVCLGDLGVNEADAMMDFCHEINAAIRGAAKGVRSCAAFLACYNEVIGTVCYVNAGHTPGLLRYDGDISELPATGMPLGLFSASTYEAPTVAVPVGGGLLLASRGVVEAASKKEEFGLPRLSQTLLRTPLASAEAVAAAVLTAVREFSASAAQQNDLTALALVRPLSN